MDKDNRMKKYSSYIINPDHYVKYNDMNFSKESLTRVWQHLKNGFILTSDFRGEYSQDENLERTKKLQSIIKEYGLGYFIVDGTWIENRGTKNEHHSEELSFFIPYMHKYTPDDFVNIAETLREKFNQDAILVKDPSKGFEHLMCIFRDQSVKIMKGKFGPDQIAQAYSKFKGGKHAGRTFIFEGTLIPSNSMSVHFFNKEKIYF